ncbi:MAG: hypothetical protein COX62_03635 [Deltaproteobacteria bacterium CG_4_10_14_0_2_um_filter_43_8]|nr:MAG: hypothetical protein COV43_05720 [Deltaproteobacteria bacterium CG11_big_fil_rev_8_21_14_0_20_42_23]PJA20975.1 MAG: hypothetical protein COX62_03635 [Deltaproteobacteria bacterium CG_4_10_14_0_2_um_filter_43_8]PJC63663.1 MAG: hypothetical protein CO021_08240 [Deltaproteobacteria bacterium CG_4_9_14_0_2_um_filter_42_21]
MTKKQKKIIKRYRNRKLYDTQDSCYVTLEDIAEMIKMGDEVHVVENANGEDITAVTLAQIIFEEQKKKRNELPLDTFIDIIRTGGGMFKEIMSKTLETGVREFSHVKEIMDEKRKNTEAKRPSPLIDEMNELKRKIAALEKKLK